MEANSNSNDISNTNEYFKEHNLEHIMSEIMNTLVHERIRQPEIFMIKYLSSLLNEKERIDNGINISPETLKVSTIPIVKFNESNNILVKKILTKEIWEKVKYAKTKYGASINDVLKGVNGANLTDEEVFIYINLISVKINLKNF